MGTNVESTSAKLYTDLSGSFHEGMKIEEAENKKFILPIFNNPLEEFYRIDKDNDGVLSKSEITEELYRDAEAERNAVRDNSLFGLGFAAYGLWCKKITKKHSKVAFFMTCFDLIAALHSKYQENKAYTRIAQGCN